MRRETEGGYYNFLWHGWIEDMKQAKTPDNSSRAAVRSTLDLDDISASIPELTELGSRKATST